LCFLIIGRRIPASANMVTDSGIHNRPMMLEQRRAMQGNSIVVAPSADGVPSKRARGNRSCFEEVPFFKISFRTIL
jgi:hypothetical protein